MWPSPPPAPARDGRAAGPARSPPAPEPEPDDEHRRLDARRRGLAEDARAAAAPPPPSPAYAEAERRPTRPSTETIDLLAERDAGDDAYLAELRKAMTDESPLGPREEGDSSRCSTPVRSRAARGSAAAADPPSDASPCSC